jgi:hypothetical protein
MLCGKKVGSDWNLKADCFRPICHIVNQIIEMSKKFLITAESHDVFILRRTKEKALRRYCVECGAEVEMLTLDEITTQTKTPTRELFRLIEQNSVHSIETESGHLLICRNSIEAIGQKTNINKQ